MSPFEAVLLGIVEGLTEFLPISSTGHLILASHALAIPETDFVSSFIIAIQLGAIASVIVFYWRTILFDRETIKRVIAAFIPTAIIGFALYSIVKDILLDHLALIAWALLIGGIVLVVFEKYAKRSEVATPLTYRNAILIGCAQAVALIPGVSRAGATILGGLALGISREEIVRFSFLLAVPTMLSATAYDLFKTGPQFAASEWQLLTIGFVVSFIAAAACISLLVKYVAHHSFQIFGIYRIILGAGILIFLAL